MSLIVFHRLTIVFHHFKALKEFSKKIFAGGVKKIKSPETQNRCWGWGAPASPAPPGWTSKKKKIKSPELKTPEVYLQWISPLRGSTSSVRMLTASRFLSPLVFGTYISAGWRRLARDVGSNWPSCGCIGVPRGTPWTTLHIHGEPLPRWPRRGRVHARCFLGELLVACFLPHQTECCVTKVRV